MFNILVHYYDRVSLLYVGTCLKSLLHSAKNKSLYDYKFHPRNDFYVIDSNEPVLDFINSNNLLKKCFRSINTYDFSTLYTIHIYTS